ncbi:hypothetical protein Tco_1347048 [Tanacetum coccineum]
MKKIQILIKEIQQLTTDAVIRNQGASIKTLEIQIGQMSKVLQERGFGSLPSSTEQTQEIKSSLFLPILKLIHIRYAILDLPNTPYPMDRTVSRCGLAHTRLKVELADRTVKNPKGIAENVLVGIVYGDVQAQFHNSIMKNKMMYKGNNVVGAVMNVPIFVGTFSIVTDFAVLENMDAYHEKRMGDVIVREPFLREVGIKAKRFEGIITFYKGDDEVTYQMVRSHLRFKNYTNEQCNKILPLLKVSENDEKNEISHAYQKLKGFYKGVLNLGPDYIRNAKTEEWLTRRHISVHEME